MPLRIIYTFVALLFFLVAFGQKPSKVSKSNDIESQKAKANEYFEKPIDPEFFLESINKYYTGGENGSK